MKHLLFITIIISLFGCAKDEITIYNDYGGNSSDSTGYYNIFYHDFEPDIKINENNDYLVIDFNNDDNPDFAFSFNMNQLAITSLGSIICTADCDSASINNKKLISKMDTGFLVQSTLDFNYYSWESSYTNPIILNVTGCTPVNGEFYIGIESNHENMGNPQTKYQTHNYGWLRMEVFGNSDSLVIKDYAYNLIENSPIKIGDK